MAIQVQQYEAMLNGSVGGIERDISRAGPAGDLVVLSIEPIALNPVPPTLSFSGEGEGTRSGMVAGDRLSIAGQWSGSGVRQGRLVFTLRADAAGAFNVPIRLVLSAP